MFPGRLSPLIETPQALPAGPKIGGARNIDCIVLHNVTIFDVYTVINATGMCCADTYHVLKTQGVTLIMGRDVSLR